MTASEYRAALSEYKVDPADTDGSRLHSIRPFLSLLDNVEKSSIALFDMAEMQDQSPEDVVLALLSRLELSAAALARVRHIPHSISIDRLLKNLVDQFQPVLGACFFVEVP